jgi:hypothetical protein
MNLQKYIEGLNKFAEENPECLDMQVIGSDFNRVFDSPEKGKLEVCNTRRNNFTSVDQFYMNDIDEKEVNAVCVN